MTLNQRLTKAVHSISQEYDADLYEEARDKITELEDLLRTGVKLITEYDAIVETLMEKLDDA